MDDHKPISLLKKQILGFVRFYQLKPSLETACMHMQIYELLSETKCNVLITQFKNKKRKSLVYLLFYCFSKKIIKRLENNYI